MSVEQHRRTTTLRLPTEVHARLTAAAAADERSVNAYLVRLLNKHLPQADAQLELEEIAS